MTENTGHRKRVAFTFGNHMHWVDMQWLWGEDVLPGSVRDMLHLCRETGMKGNVNFDGIGYEKMAAECPEALASLRDAVAEGTIEPVGCSYGQPYGLFQGGESNIRQFTFGVRSVRRLLGVWPRAFWEEEFYFFPQLPQVLSLCGFASANLFFQWTWHTPEVPKENASLILWEGIDGTRLPTLPRNDLNLHQWPEDFAPLVDSPLLVDLDQPAIVQWIELMPTKDWMCRSEVLLPKLKELLAHPDFEIVPATMSELVASLSEDASEIPVRRYTMDDVWHGMTLGKNGDTHPRVSIACEHFTLMAESMFAMMGLFGRPYPSWGVYPTWELNEAWRETLSAQHHDNHECEGLCGSIGQRSFDRALGLVEDVRSRAVSLLGARVAAPPGSIGAYNPCGWMRDVRIFHEEDGRPWTVPNVPPFGYRFVSRTELIDGCTEPVVSLETKEAITLSRGSFRVSVNRITGCITTLGHDSAGNVETQIGRVSMTCGGVEETFPMAIVVLMSPDDELDDPTINIMRRGEHGQVLLHVRILPRRDAVELGVHALDLDRPDPGLNAAFSIDLDPGYEPAALLADTPLSISRIKANGSGKRKYPEGDWMTSPQWFEEVHRPFTASSLVDLLRTDNESGAGLLVVHDGSPQFFRTDEGVRNVLNAYDPWDEAYWESTIHANFLLMPHEGLSGAERYRFAQTLCRFGEGLPYGEETGDLPEAFGPVSVENAPGVVMAALYRERMKAGEHLPQWAGHRMHAESDGACDHPYVVRLVEYNGDAAEVVLKFPGAVALAAKTNLIGEGTEGDDVPVRCASEDGTWLDVEYPCPPPEWVTEPLVLRGEEVSWSAVRFTMRPHEIATIMVDLVLGRKEWRDLDQKREVWAQIHRRNEEGQAS